MVEPIITDKTPKVVPQVTTQNLATPLAKIHLKITNPPPFICSHPIHSHIPLVAPITHL